MNMKRKNRFGTYILFVCIAVFSLVFIGAILSSQNKNPYQSIIDNAVEEKVIVSVNSFTTTRYEYSGIVTITIQGDGQLSLSDFHDAFHKFDENNNAIGYFQGLRIDGNETLFSIFTGVFPAYNPDHQYRFLYQIEGKPSVVQFLIENSNTQDADSRFIVEVSTLDKVTAPGR